MWSTHSRRIDPISRSAKPFCQGEAGAIGLSREPGPAGHLAPQNDQLMSERTFSASSRLFDLNGEASTARTKQISAIISPI